MASVVAKQIQLMSIEEIVQQALTKGFLTPTMEAEVGRICDSAAELSVEEYMALDELMGALLTGQVATLPRKQFINVMEELVLTEAITRVARAENTSNSTLDLGDVAAYALNRLPPLYATTEEGASYQRQRARQDLHWLITQQVDAAIAHNLDRPEFFPERQSLGGVSEDIMGQITTLLQAYAPTYETPFAS